MNIKHKLTLTMWSLPFSFIMVVFGSTFEIVGIGVILMVAQTILWNKLLKEIEDK